MFKRILGRFSSAAVLILLMSLTEFSMASTTKGTAPSSQIKKAEDLQGKIQHSLLMLPYYGVFDELNFTLQGDTVILTGEVRRALLRSEAEYAVRHTAGVADVVNKIEILPVSTTDDSIRWMTYRAIYSQPGFEKYGVQAVRPIRIIVKNGNITLVGVVASQVDKTTAKMAARHVPFAFSVSDDLTVD